MIVNILRQRAVSALVAQRASFPLRTQGGSVLSRFACPRPSVSAVQTFSYSTVFRQENRQVERRSRPPSPPSDTLYVGNCPFDADEQTLREFFGQYGAVTGIRMALNGDGTGKGYCHVEFKDKNDATAVFDAARDQPLHLNNRALRIDFASPFPAGNTRPFHQLYFSGLRSDEPFLESALSNYKHALIRIKLLMDPGTGQPTGTGFLVFDSPQSATEVLKVFNGAKLDDGTLLKLSYARRKTTPPSKTTAPYNAQ